MIIRRMTFEDYEQAEELFKKLHNLHAEMEPDMYKKLDCVKELYTTWNEHEQEYDIRMSNGIVFDAAKVEVNFISSINQYVDFLGQI